nr:hypothetical protein [Tanacetum cinerariifolium]
MGEPLSPDHVFDFPEDELEPHLAYDFFTPAPLPGYVGNPKNNNGWLEADDHLLGEIEAMVGKPTVVPAIEEVAEPVAEAEEEHVITPTDDDFEDDDSNGFDEEEAWEVNEEWLMAPFTPPLVPAVQPPSVYKVGGLSTRGAEGPSFPHLALGLSIPPFMIEDLSTHLGNLKYEHGQLVQRINQVSNAEVAASFTIGEIGPRIYAIEGQVQTATQRDETIAELTQQVQALQIDVQQRDT